MCELSKFENVRGRFQSPYAKFKMGSTSGDYVVNVLGQLSYLKWDMEVCCIGQVFLR